MVSQNNNCFTLCCNSFTFFVWNYHVITWKWSCKNVKLSWYDEKLWRYFIKLSSYFVKARINCGIILSTMSVQVKGRHIIRSGEVVSSWDGVFLTWSKTNSTAATGTGTSPPTLGRIYSHHWPSCSYLTRGVEWVIHCLDRLSSQQRRCAR